MRTRNAPQLLILLLSPPAYANIAPDVIILPVPNGRTNNGIDLATLTMTRNGSQVTNLALSGSLLVGTQNGVSIDARQMKGLAMSANLLNHDALGNLTAPTPVTLTIQDVQQLDTAANADVWLYQVTVTDSTGTYPLCVDPTDSSNWATAIAGEWEQKPGPMGTFSRGTSCHTRCFKSPGEGGAYDCETVCGSSVTWGGGMKVPGTDRTTFTFGCRHQAALEKCVELGYKPWATGTAVTTTGAPYSIGSLADLHQSCVRAIRADYCGDGVAHTRPGTPIDIMDYASIQKHDPTDIYTNGAFTADAEWTSAGATCVSNLRYSQIYASTGALVDDVHAYVLQNCPQVLSAVGCNSNYTNLIKGGSAVNPNFLINTGTGTSVSTIQDFAKPLP